MGIRDWTINGHAILEPTSGRWMPRRPLDVQGDNRPIYPGVRTFELRWQLASYADWAALQVSFDSIESSGDNVVTLPAYPTETGSSYAFREYSGTTMSEPLTGPLFETYPSNVVLLIGNIPAS